MLSVKSPEEALEIIEKEFKALDNRESIALSAACGRVLAEDIRAEEYVPDFDRSTVDGYAIKAKDSFGCSEAIPAMLFKSGRVLMGKAPKGELKDQCCFEIPTGGALPQGADSVQMVEYTEDYGDGSIGIFKSTAPGQNVIFKGDDVYPGKMLLKAGRVLEPKDIGALAAAGITELQVARRLKVGIISTGDELVEPDVKPGPGQMRDVNGPMLEAMMDSFGAEARFYGIIKDNEQELFKAMRLASEQCDAVIISGGSSVGQKDASSRVISQIGELLFHGIAIKPGKPTILGKTGNKPLIGLPGHPVAAYFITRLFVYPLLGKLMGRNQESFYVKARLSENVSANHGRAQCMGVRLIKEGKELKAVPIRSKSGLITSLAGSDGFFCIDRDCEGLPEGAEIKVILGE